MAGYTQKQMVDIVMCVTHWEKVNLHLKEKKQIEVIVHPSLLTQTSLSQLKWSFAQVQAILFQSLRVLVLVRVNVTSYTGSHLLQLGFSLIFVY